ncbi:mannitol dehydrogenase family protein [Allobranchiibius huperziae]|uniref:Mannitol 2-dehydrogenase n=1 Tax=Allobranchiibius huperziae TaxID=1874116 RepID=A0A853DDF1_9MICO|nr:mannitol dehydrogenase family protein [Allobranchiibius huperziae]NYJ74918.1 mannitol 2-dehydrogenase [Allobranchiibius huperziae]
MTERIERAVKLQPDSLQEIARRGVAIPTYDRASLTTSIVHVGVGGFHRAHQAMYLNRLLEMGIGRESICGVGVLPSDDHIRDVMSRQGCLYTLVIKHPDGSLKPQVIGSITEYLFAPDGPQEVVEKMAAPTTRTVSLTITEGGYPVDPRTRAYLAEKAATLDAAVGWPTGRQSPFVPSAFGLIVEALRRRHERGQAPFTVMSCDNLAHNGQIARAAVVGYARGRDPDLADWIDGEGRFPNSMVDRITPVTTDGDRAAVETLGIDDEWPVVTEPYVQWVLEDSFTLGRPAWERAGVQVVDDVSPWETMKLRLANGGHQALCHLGALAGYTYAHEAAGDPAIGAYLGAYLEEALPTLTDAPGLGAETFRDALLPRWRNAAIADTLDRIRTDSSDRLPTWLLPVVEDNLRTGGPIVASSLACAAWAHACQGRTDADEVLPILDHRADLLARLAAAQLTDPSAFIAESSLFGRLATDDRFKSAFEGAYATLVDKGARAAAAAFQD